MNAPVKREIVDQRLRSGNDIVSSNSSNSPTKRDNPAMVIHLSSSSSSSTSSSDSGSGTSPDKGRVGRSRNVDVVLGKKRMRESSEEEGTAVLPPGFLSAKGKSKAIQASKQFWKAGDFDGDSVTDAPPSAGGIDHVRIHPKFLHSNATSHKWALGAFAELLDNSLDEVCNGATFVSINVADNTKDQSKMLLIEDDGGGMDPDKMRQCMSLGYSMKSKMANTIGQYGNGFKTSTMRLGADVIVFSRCCGKDGKIRTQSIGLLSYTFLRSTKQADIIVPMLDYEKIGGQWAKILWSSSDDWDRNLRTIVEWSPFSSEMDLLCQFNLMKMHGTRVIIYNLWEDGEGQLELDFDADPHDIQLRGVNRDEKNIQMAKTYPNSKHFLTYRHSLRSYASILYLRLPPGFRVILRGCDVEHHNVVNDMMLTQKITYRPMSCPDGSSKDSMTAVVTIGFVKDAKHHIDVQGFNVYHKNRLIKPFWRLWNAAGSDGRGVIGVLEANFVEPAHDKQGFERTTVLGRLESKLIQMQKTYWRTHCHFVGYSKRSNKTSATSFADREDSADYSPQEPQSRNKYKSHSTLKEGLPNKPKKSTPKRSVMTKQSPEVLPVPEAASDNDLQNTPEINVDGCRMPGRRPLQRAAGSISSKGYNNTGKESVNSDINDAVTVENSELQGRLEKNEKEIQSDLLKDLLYERDRCKELEAQLLEAQQKIEELNKEQESLIDIFSEERQRRDKVEESLRKKLKESSDMIQDLLGKINTLEGKKGST